MRALAALSVSSMREGPQRPRAVALLGIAFAAAIATPRIATSQPVVVAQKLTSIAANTPTAADPTLYLAFTPLCPSEAGDGAFVTRWNQGAVPPRALVSVNPARPPGTCNPYQLASNVHVDEDAIYYVDNQGPGGAFVLSRKLRTANAADAPAVLWNFGSNLVSAELLTYTSSLFVIVRRSGQNDEMWQLDKTTGALISVNVTSGAPFQLSSMQVDTRYLYWLNAGVLWRNDLTNGAQVPIASGVTSYFNEGYSEDCSPLGCTQLARVLYGQQHQIRNRYNLDPPFAVYTSPDANATITGITRDGTKYYFFERRPVPGGGFDRDDRLFRLPVGSVTPDLILPPIDNGGPGFDSLHTDLTWLYFRNRATRELLRLPNDAAEIPVYALRATSIELTQGVQTPTNSVPLIQGRRTFARLHVANDGASAVGNVDAQLSVFDGLTQEFLGTLRPRNDRGAITVFLNASRTWIDDSFYFELPLDWTRRSRLSFTGVVNPTNVILENDYSNNVVATPAYEFGAPTRLPLHVVSWAYNYGNTFVTPGGLDDWNSLRWIERVYPLPSSGGPIGLPGDGLRTDSTAIVDDALAARVARTHGDCAPLLVPATATTPAVDNREQCAGNYVVGRIRAMRSAGDLPRDRYYYASIGGQSGVTPFTRGFAPPNETIACGPSKDLDAEQNYMAHEVGHLLGRGHPGTGGGGVCGNQDAADGAYPYPQARIGNSTSAATDASTVVGFDFGDTRFATPVVKGASTRGDIMSYCDPYWVSDYTYVGLYDQLSTVQPGGGGGGGGGAGPGDPPIPGDWLIASGMLSLAEDEGAFTTVQRRDTVSAASAPETGPWQLELRSAGGALLAAHPFTPEPIADEPTAATFSFAVPFVAGTRELRITEAASGAVAASEPVSASPPAVSDVQLVGAPSPVTGDVTVAWTASDPDGDTLAFDVLLTRDAGASFQPVALSVSGTSAVLDTSAWGGGTAQLRVVASDGAQNAVADGAPFAVADKAPIVRIVSPTPNAAIDWGQVVNFIATIDDPQDAEIPDEDIVWSNAYRVLGTGRALGVDDLEVGANLVTVTVFNQAGLGAQASVMVLVGDDLTLPGPRVSVVPSTIDVSVSGGETELQSVSLDVVNAGGGVLSYIATSSTTWLFVDGTSSTTGTAPQTIAVTIDPSSLPDTAVSTAEILVYNALDLDEVVSVPVTVAKGDLVGGHPFTDTDGDEIDDRDDNCPLAPNADQADADADGFGDACETECVNGLDDDGDGLVDFGADPGCQTEANTDESPKCDDDLDNDGDGGTDWDGGPSAGAPDPQCVGKPWKNKEASGCGLGAEVALLLPLLRWLRRRGSRCSV